MKNEIPSPRAVRELPKEVARKIAAGEVIDRPAAVVRELMDNSIDAGATKISVEIRGGGIDGIRVTDNGFGMTSEDISLCAHAHTTSKIREEDDLLTLTTLGFRGEALSSIDAVSRLEIQTTRDGHEAWKLQFGKVTPTRLSVGTIVNIDGLFENFPARRQFLKRPASETLLCSQIFIEKALPWPALDFRFSVDGNAKKILLPAKSLRERCLAALEPKENETFFYEISGAGNGFSFSVILGSPDVIRSDRKHLMVFVNNRRIIEYSLLQALEYGVEGHFPNGAHPFGILFIAIDPSLVDFNIHPAKREARFRDSATLHHAVSTVIRDFYKRYTIAALHREQTAYPGFGFPAQNTDKSIFPHREYPEMTAYHSSTYHTEEIKENTVFSPNGSTSQDFRFLGQVLGTFLVIEKNDMLYLIDQHAAHERILYDDFISRSKEAQELLIPYRIETQSDAENSQLEKKKDSVQKAGFVLVNEGDGIWQVTSVPGRWKGSQKDLADDLLNPAFEGEALISHLFASAACRAACKDGDILDPQTARTLVQQALALENPVCPHGRPLWIIIDREELFHRIKRTT